MLIWLLIVPVLACLLIGLLSAPGRVTALVSAGITLVLGLYVVVVSMLPDFDTECLTTFCGIPLQFTTATPLCPLMLLLTVVVTFAALLGMHAPGKAAERSWSISTLLISTGATGAFLSDNIISFYAFHELALIPTFVMIGYYGRGERRTIAWRTTIYLGLASMVLLAGLIMLCIEMSTTSISQMHALVTVYGKLPGTPVTMGIISGLLLAGFGTLVSLFPFHSWAAPAYASAPTPIAMLHAGVLKKFGLYGLFTLAWALGPASRFLFGGWNEVLLVLLLGNVLWVGYVTVAQTRLDKMLGNSSVMHMGYLFLAFAAYVTSSGSNYLALQGAGMLMLAHGLSIAMLFLLAGQIEQRTGTLELCALGGLARRAPTLGFLFGLAGMASIGLPLLANFVGEFAIFLSCFVGWVPGASSDCGSGCGFLDSISSLLGGLGSVQLCVVFALWGLVISAIYMLRAIRRIFAGEIAPSCENVARLSCSEVLSASLLGALLLLFGIAPFLII